MLGYHPSFGGSPFPGVVCLSVNDAVLHGTDGSRGAHVEHTVAVTDSGPRMLTV